MNPSWPKMTTDKVVAERILMIHPFGIGDALFMTPTIRTLKENGAEQIDLLLGSRTRAIFETNPHVNHIYEWDKAKPQSWRNKIRYWIKLFRMFLEIRHQRYQAVFDYSLGREYAFWAWILFGIADRIGFNFKNRGVFLTRKIDLPDGFSEKPVAEYYRDLLTLYGVPNQARPLEFYFHTSDEDSVRHLMDELTLKPGAFFAVAPGGGESWGRDSWLKRWPVSFFAVFIQRIFVHCGLTDIPVVIIGANSERRLGDQMKRLLPEMKVHNLCGSMPLRSTAALIQKAMCVIANDGGLVHVSRAVQTPLIAFYGPVNPHVYGPYPEDSSALAIVNTGPKCRPCYRRMRYQADCAGNECLTTLTPDYAFDFARSAHFLERLADRKTVLT